MKRRKAALSTTATALALAAAATVVGTAMSPAATASAFAPPSSLPRPPTTPAPRLDSDAAVRFRRSGGDRRRPGTTRPTSTSLNLLGQDGGILGVGAPEIAVTLLVGYFVLGPSELYKLVKEIGKFVQNFRTLGAEAAKSFEGTMENQLELSELRKAQAELNEAFSFRRSINTDQGGEVFENTGFAENASASAAAGAATAAATATAGAVGEEGGGAATKKKRRLVRRKKKKIVDEDEEVDVPSEDDFMLKEYPDLDTLDDVAAGTASSEEERLRAERLERLSGGGRSGDEPDWYTASEEEVASQVLDGDGSSRSGNHRQQQQSSAMESYQNQRFQSQLSAEEWNSRVMANEDKLSPLAMVMQRLAILEDEKNAADRRLEEEYQRRMDNEDKYYLEKRRALEEAITEIQQDVYGGAGGGEGKGRVEESGPRFTA